ncbi:MAG: DUF3467 domain-containing protein [candidate division NC10 bacterium]|nr:DUF3467 domain-containing protein [candidate division NC10 bacterium]
MAEVPEVYSDVFWVTLNPYTALLDFGTRLAPLREHAQHEEGQEAENRTFRVAARIRMSPEHAKVLAFILRRHVQDYERQTGITIDVPVQILNDLRIPPEDWRQFGQ